MDASATVEGQGQYTEQEMVRELLVELRRWPRLAIIGLLPIAGVMAVTIAMGIVAGVCSGVILVGLLLYTVVPGLRRQATRMVRSSGLWSGEHAVRLGPLGIESTHRSSTGSTTIRRQGWSGVTAVHRRRDRLVLMTCERRRILLPERFFADAPTWRQAVNHVFAHAGRGTDGEAAWLSELSPDVALPTAIGRPGTWESAVAMRHHADRHQRRHLLLFAGWFLLLYALVVLVHLPAPELSLLITYGLLMLGGILTYAAIPYVVYASVMRFSQETQVDRRYQFAEEGLYMLTPWTHSLAAWDQLAGVTVTDRHLLLRFAEGMVLIIPRRLFGTPEEDAAAVALVTSRLGVCPKCGYPRRGVDRPTCPECGTAWQDGAPRAEAARGAVDSASAPAR